MDVILSKLANNLRIEGVEENAVKDILQKVGEYWEFISGIDWDNVDYFGILKEISVARFLKAKFNDETKISIMRQTLSYRGNGVCIFKPNNFEESSVVGEPICCFAFSQGRWEEHYNEYQESIYYVYDALREGTIEDFVAITVRPSGKALVLDKEHNWWSSSQSNQFIKGLGEGALVIKTKDGKPVKLETNENKQHKTRYNMKKTIRLSESDLHRVIRESMKRALNEMEGNELNLRGDMPDYGTISLSDLQKALKMAWFDDLEKIENRQMLFGLDDELKSRVEDILSKYKKLCEECRQLAHQIERMPGYQFSSDYIFNGEA